MPTRLLRGTSDTNGIEEHVPHAEVALRGEPNDYTWLGWRFGARLLQHLTKRIQSESPEFPAWAACRHKELSVARLGLDVCRSVVG
jgi:hypothetical protein